MIRFGMVILTYTFYGRSPFLPRIGNATEVNRRMAWEEKAAKSDFDLDIDDSNGFGNADKGHKLRFFFL